MRVGLRLTTVLLCLTSSAFALPAQNGEATSIHAEAAATPSPWRTMTLTDLEAAKAMIEAQDINAVYPAPSAFAAKFDTAMATAEQEASAVSTFAGYRATLKHFMNSLDDEHAGVAFSITQSRLFWPGFVIRRLGGRYVTAASTIADVPDGQEVFACDGTPMDERVERTAAYEGGHAGLESTKASAALLTLIDQANPFLKRPTACTVGGKSVQLSWVRIYYADYAQTLQLLAGRYDRTVAISDIGGDVAWVRLGNFNPETPTEAAAFRSVIDEAPSLRGKKAIILDVRHNGGGPYDWMIAFLNSLYGKDYATFYARARLSIQPVYRATPEILGMYKEGDAADAAVGSPGDPQTEIDSTKGVAQALSQHRPYFRATLVQTAPPNAPPPSPVRAKVFVLTDYLCASVCIGFVDELKRFPGVRQIGTETFVDSRSGTPMTRPLPSGNASIYVPTMTRDGRVRDDNVPQRPDTLFQGDIADTAAVQRWILDKVL